MKIPLAITPADDKLIIYRNGERESVPLPFKPFAMIQKDQFPYSQGPVEKWRKVPEDEEREYVRLSFNSIQELNKFKGQVSDKSRYVLINSYVEQLFISQEDFLLKYPHTNELTVMFFDIEVATKGDGFFPRPVSNPILCIGYSIWKYRPDGTKYKVHHEICKGFSVENDDDSDVIDKFFQGIEKWDPDIIAGYYSGTFDIPYIIERAEICRVDTARMSRGGKKPIIRDSDVYIPGRIQFDIYASNAGVFKDQTLFGIKSRSLKEIARWYKAKRTILDSNGAWKTEDMQDIELPGEIENLVKLLKENPERLYAYQDDDVYRTEWVGHVYIRNCITLAEMLKVPLNNIINMYSSFVPKLFVARNMERIGLINTESNFSRYNPANGSIEAIGTKFQAAISELFRSGFVPATWKLDFLSQYPSIIMTFGLGIDTTKLVKLEKYTGKYECKEKENYIWYRLPSSFDKGKYRYDLIVRVRKGGGFLGKEIKKLMEERKKIKASMEKASEEEYDALNSQQTAIKIIMNSIFGLMGLKSTVYGDMITATMITGLARWCLTRSMQHVREHVVNCDTDGFVVDCEIDADKETKWLDGELKKKFFVKNNKMILELEGNAERGYFYRPKNYIIETVRDGKVQYTIHGSSLKASKAAKVVDRAVSLGIDWIFNDKPPEEVIREAYKFKDLPIEYFTERVNLSKEPKDYDDNQDWRVYLAEQVKVKTGQVISKGDQISYVVTKEELPYKAFDRFKRSGRNYTYIGYVESSDELDLSYYKDMISKALEKFGISKEKMILTDLFDSTRCEKKPIIQGKLSKVPKENI